MNRSNFRLLPTLETAPGGASASAESDLVALFGDLIARGERDEESPDYELLEAAVDGKLDAVEAEIFASRLAPGDPVLASEFAELVALRDRLHVVVAPARVKTSQPASHRWVGFAAAAVLLAVAGLGFRLDLDRDYRPAATTSASLSQDRSSTSGASDRQVVFADSFEGGTTDHWSN